MPQSISLSFIFDSPWPSVCGDPDAFQVSNAQENYKLYRTHDIILVTMLPISTKIDENKRGTF